MTNIPGIPHSPTTESAIIGGLLIDPEQIKGLALTGSDFYLEKNRWVFETIQAVRLEGKEPDLVTVCQRLNAEGRLNEIGGVSAISQMVQDCATSMHVSSYAKVIRELARRRKVIYTAQELATGAFNQELDLDGVVSTAMDKLSHSANQSGGAAHISESIGIVYDEAEKAYKNPVEIYGIPTGFKDWDAITFGLQRGTVIKITGEPGVGKSLLAMQVLAEAAKAGHPGALYELEMRKVNVIRRLVSGHSKIPTWSMQQGRMNEEQWSLFVQAIDQLGQLPVYIEANSQLTTADIRADLHRLKAQAGVELVVIDYESLLNDTTPGGDEIRLSSLRSSRVHGIATDLDMAVISLDDMNKGGIAGTTSGMTGMSGSGRKLHDADEIIFMRTDKSNPRLRTLTWHKNREGASNKYFQLLLQEGYPAFYPVERRPYGL